MAQQRLQLTWYNKDKALIPSQEGRYDYTWVEPSDPRVREVHPLIFDEYVRGVQSPKDDEYEYSECADLVPSEDNLLILGESGEVLKALTRTPELAEKYVGKVKLVYIDPPFNTAQTFTHYEDNLEHSIWLSMMRDRLYMLKDLLSEDGSIWVHLDYAENHRMRLLLDEVFGAGKFIAEVVWQKSDSTRNDATYFSSDQDIILVYRAGEGFTPNRLPRPESMNTRFLNPDNDPLGAWAPADPCAPDAPKHQSMVYAIQHPMTGELMYPTQSRCWVFSSETMFREMSKWAHYELRDIDDRAKRAAVSGIALEDTYEIVPAMMLAESLESSSAKVRKLIESGETLPELVFTRAGLGRIMRKSRIPTRGLVPRTLWLNEDVSHSRGAKKEMGKLFPGKAAFSTPKPERLLERIIHIATNPGDLVVDVFAGSGTTAAVAQKMGRRWITCELLENTFNQFTKARLEKVVNDQDPGGITQTKGARIASADSPLPQGVSADDAAKFTSVLNKLVGNDPELAGSAKGNPLIKQLKQAAKTTRTKTILNWRGGGGFQVAHIAPACFTYNEELGITQFTDQAWGDVLKSSVVANLGYSLLDPEEDSWFEGRCGNTMLKVYEGILTTDIADGFLAYLEPQESLVIAATALEDGVREYVRKARKGSRALHIRDDLF